MPAGFPSSFASAAAGNSSDSASRRTSGRGDGSGLAEWGRRPNGATQTFRRPSLATTSSHSAHQRDLSASASASILSPSATSAAPLSAQPFAGRNGAFIDTRYSREALFEQFKQHRDAGDLDHDLSDLYMGDFENDIVPAMGRWSRRDETAVEPNMRPDVCLNPSADTEPLGLSQFTPQERELFTTSVNSPLKAPNPGATKDGQPAGPRKLSISHSHGLAGLTSPTTARPMHRRREPSETFSRDQLTSPTASKFSRDDDNALPPALLRRKTESKDFGASRLSEDDEQDDGHGPSGTPFSLSRRVTTGPLSAGLNGPQSPWSQPAAGGAFGNFSLSNGSGSVSKRPVGGLTRAESRFKGLMSRDSVENTRSPIQEQASHGSLGRSSDQHNEPTDADRFSSGNNPIGSAALGGAHEETVTGRTMRRGQHLQGYSDADPSGGVPVGGEGERTGSHMDSRGQQPGQEAPLSPTFTNPYHSPERDASRLNDMTSDDIDFNNLHLPGLGGLQAEGFAPGAGRGPSSFENRPFERQQSFGPPPSRGFPGLGSLGGLPAVSSPGGWGAPRRERGFDGLGELGFRQDSNLPTPMGALGPVTPFGSAPRPTLDRAGSTLGSSRLGSLFPSAMQEQIRGNESARYRQQYAPEGDMPEDSFDPFNGRGPAQGFGLPAGPPRETDSPFNRNNDLGSTNESSPAQTSQRLQPIGSQTNLAKASGVDQHQHQQSGGHANVSGQPPAAQQKQMVMPDRIRWIYRDPQGNTQGPWSGLEMHDWYRAGFFSPELLVKKVEDPDYEPLAQLIRRIGNSREPFLVPQIGIPGPPSATASGAWPNQPPQAQPAPTSNQPPFASSFPTFGTTLTAEQQNALERRKQEEQYLMARQKEHLAQQQVYHKMQMQNMSFPGAQQSQSLQHHSSAQSLQSQQSFGSTTNFQAGASGSQGFEGGFRQPANAGTIGANLESLGHIKEEDQLAQSQFADPNAQDQALADRARLALEQADYNKEHDFAEDADRGAERFDEFQRLQDESELSGEQEMYDPSVQHAPKKASQQSQGELAGAKANASTRRKAGRVEDDLVLRTDQGLTLTEQVQKAASAKKSPASAIQSPWAKVDKPITESHPASQTSSPLPAPAARRSGGQSVADQLAADTSSQRNSPVVDTMTSVAPWARENLDAQKQPSLKEIQEAEAKRAAKQEELAIATRRAALEKEMATQAPPPAPGLPSSSTWASGDTMMSPIAGANPWSKPATGKPTASSATASKKTLQQIQKEEEALAKRQRQLAAAAAAANVASTAGSGANASSPQAISVGKRYADLASRTSEQSLPPASAWTTVGAGGKPKAGATTPAPPPALNRAASSSIATAVTGTVHAKATGTPTRAMSGSVLPAFNAQDEFKRWATGELRPDLKKGIQVDEFVSSLLNLPMDPELITEAVHSASSTMDSRHFAEEFVKRRALADKGKTQPPSGSSALSQPTSDGKGGGWSEVASRKPGAATPAAKEEGTSGFKIVPSKKKGGKR